MAAGSTIGTLFKITTWGESHGKAIGVVVDGCPAGLELCEADIQKLLDRRKPGQSKFTTQRSEGDEVEILSGVFEGKTTGTPISMVVWNKDQRSKDYSLIASCYRPGHADYTFDEKFGFRDYRGGGRSSARETIGRVAAGAIAEKFLESLGIGVMAYTRSIGPVEIDGEKMDLAEIANNKLCMPDKDAAKKAAAYLEEKMAECDSVGGVVECVVSGLPVGLGEPVFEKLDANLAKAILSIGAVKGFEIGDGFAASRACGSENNDAFRMGEDGQVKKVTNHSGGVLGGMSDGSDVVFCAAFKPTPSIAKAQDTVKKDGENMELVIHGRHDPVVVPRAVVVVEAMAAITVMDALLMSMTSRMDLICKFFEK
ncbi:MAG: chorismate synthase [Lachnospiraceae bacterium]|nr:chorismate synthase [Lachnospiraceae bacterium]